MAEERASMFDKFSLAEMFARVLLVEVKYLTRKRSLGGYEVDAIEAVAVKAVLIEVFPWLGNYHICQDGNDLRWKAWNDLDDESAIVFPRLVLCTKQVRDWILQFVEVGGAHG